MAKRKSVKRELENRMIELLDAQKEYEVGTDNRKAIDQELLQVSEALNKTQCYKKNEWLGPVIAGGVGILQVLLITKHEDISCLTSKAIGFVTKPKL